MQDTILVPLANGFEEIEAVTIVDVLRRAELPVKVAGLEAGPVTGAHGLEIGTDCALSEVDASTLRMIVLPGGIPGATNLMEDERVIGLVRELAGSGRNVAAICAAPIVLAKAGVLDGVAATSYPGFQDQLAGASYVEERVVRAGNVMTSRGPGTALEFALGLVEELAGASKSAELGQAMLAAGA